VDDGCRIYSTNKADLASPDAGFALLGEADVCRKWGVAPRLIGDALALIGDTVDNIPGVNGLGPKTAAALLNEHGSLDAILASPDAVKNERIREKLRAARGQIEGNREMVRLDDELPLPVPLDEMHIAPRWAELVAALERCEFKNLTAEVRKEAGAAAPTGGSPQGELF
jgi:5'-3' exonuclease